MSASLFRRPGAVFVPGRNLEWLCEETSTPHVNLLVDDAPGVHERLRAAGVAVGDLSPLEDAWSFWFRDVFGNVFGVASLPSS